MLKPGGTGLITEEKDGKRSDTVDREEKLLLLEPRRNAKSFHLMHRE